MLLKCKAPTEPKTPKTSRGGAGLIFHFTLSELAFPWKNHPQDTLLAATPLMEQGQSLPQVPLVTRDSCGYGPEGISE